MTATTITPPPARLNRKAERRRRTQNREARQRTRDRQRAGLALYWLTLPVAQVCDLLETEGLLPRYPQVGREHVHRHAEIEAALTAYFLQKISQR